MWSSSTIVKVITQGASYALFQDRDLKEIGLLRFSFPFFDLDEP